ncbi:MAG: hypothetical protein V4539_06745 [Bacteroidota bacterium]
MRNVITWLQSIEKGYEPRNYAYEADAVPIGHYDALLECKVWAKKVSAVCCYFKEGSTGKRFQLTVYNNGGTGYFLKDCPVDFTKCPVGVMYHIRVSLSAKGLSKFEFAKLA